MTWQSKVLALCKKYGGAAKFAATTILGIVPGGPALTPLIEQVFDTAQKTAQDDWELNLSKQVHLTAENVARLDQVLDILGGDLQHLMAQLASLQQMPGMAAQLLIIARDNDDRCKTAIRKLDQLSHQTARIESGISNITAAQQEAGAKINEILLLVRQISAPAVGDQRIVTTVTTIAQKVDTVSNKAAYLDESVRCGKLVLTNTNLDILDVATQTQLDRITELYAPRCSHLNRHHLAKIWQMRSLELLDISFCTSLSDADFYEVQRVSGIKPPLRHLFLRCCSQLTYHGFMRVAEMVGSLESMYVDGNFQLILSHVGAIGSKIAGLRLYSISGCNFSGIPFWAAQKAVQACVPGSQIV